MEVEGGWEVIMDYKLSAPAENPRHLHRNECYRLEEGAGDNSLSVCGKSFPECSRMKYRRVGAEGKVMGICVWCNLITLRCTSHAATTPSMLACISSNISDRTSKYCTQLKTGTLACCDFYENWMQQGKLKNKKCILKIYVNELYPGGSSISRQNWAADA